MPDREPPGFFTAARLPTAKAGPRVQLSGQVVRLALGTGPGWSEPGAELAGDRIAVVTMDGRVVYRLGAYHPDEDMYDAEWPD